MTGTPELMASRDQSTVVSRVASQILAIGRGQHSWTATIAERTFLGLNDGLQFEHCIFRDEGHRIEPYLRAARRDAIAAGVAPPSVESIRRLAATTGNVFGVSETLTDPVTSGSGSPILIHDAATRGLMSAGLEAARRLLLRVDGSHAELAVTSGGAVEADLGLLDLARHAANETLDRVRAMPPGPLVAIDATLALGLRQSEALIGHSVGRPVIHLSQYLAGHASVPMPGRRAAVSVVYQDSGPLARGLGIVDEPRSLLASVAGNGVLEATPSRRLAPSDGPLIGYPRPDLALEMARTRSRQLVETGADCIITACPYSLRNLRAADPRVPVIDLWSIVAAGWEDPPDDAVLRLVA